MTCFTLGGFITLKGMILTRVVVFSFIRGGYISTMGWFYSRKEVVLSPIKMRIKSSWVLCEVVLAPFEVGFMPRTTTLSMFPDGKNNGEDNISYNGYTGSPTPVRDWTFVLLYFPSAFRVGPTLLLTKLDVFTNCLPLYLHPDRFVFVSMSNGHNVSHACTITHAHRHRLAVNKQRPITLLTCKIKWLTGVQKLDLKDLVSGIIPKQQAAFITGR